MTQHAPTITGKGTDILLAQSEQDRVDYMRKRGAKNVDPPLPRSSHLKLLKSGHVIPYNELFAMQRDLVVNCDQYGNTDPEAWMPTVSGDEVLTEDDQIRIMQAQGELLSQALSMSNKYRASDAIDISPRPMEMPQGAEPFVHMRELRNGLDELSRRLG